MHKRNKVRKIGTDKSHRVALITNLSSALVMNEYMVTTRAKAQAFLPFLERVFSLAKPADQNAKRLVRSLLRSEKAADKIFETLLPRFGETYSGFVSIFKLGKRKGDNSEIVRLVVKGYEPPKKKTRVKEEKKIEVKKEEVKKTEEKKVTEKKVEGKKETKKQEKVEAKVETKKAEKKEEPKEVKKTSAPKPAGPKQPEKKQSWFSKLFGFGRKDRARSRSGI